jgi:hypothetical protein
MSFLEEQTPVFMAELWKLLISAQASVTGIPLEFLEKKKEEIRKRKAESEMLREKVGQKIDQQQQQQQEQQPQQQPQQPTATGAAPGLLPFPQPTLTMPNAQPPAPTVPAAADAPVAIVLKKEPGMRVSGWDSAAPVLVKADEMER